MRRQEKRARTWVAKRPTRLDFLPHAYPLFNRGSGFHLGKRVRCLYRIEIVARNIQKYLSVEAFAFWYKKVTHKPEPCRGRSVN